MNLEKTVKTNSCSHRGHLINQGIWWCNLKDFDGSQKHPKCDCENCRDFKPIEYTCLSTSTKTK